MKKNSLFGAISAVVLVGFLGSCVSLEDKMMTTLERQETEVIGSVTAEFTSYQFFSFINGTRIKSKAYAELKKAAAREYGKYGNIDIRNIVMSGGASGWEVLNVLGAGITGYTTIWLAGVAPVFYPIGGIIAFWGIGNTQKITATGDVVLYGTASRPRELAQNAQTNIEKAQTAAVPPRRASTTETTGIEGAIYRATEVLINRLPDRSKIAVLSISSRDRDNAIFVMDELEFQLVDTGFFTVVDRKTLDHVRNEQNFQSSGDVDDNSAVSMGKMLGADIVITGSISGTGSTQRLTLKALDVQTAQIVTMAREQF
jgi:TolB-like protein